MWKLMNLLRRRRERMEQDLDRELRYDLDRRVDELCALGLSEPEARRRATIELGGVAQVQEEVRDTWVTGWLHDLARDVPYGGRILRKNLSFTFVVIVSLALGIGANTAIFSLFDQMLLRALPVTDPDGLVNLRAPGPKPGSHAGDLAGHDDDFFSYPMFRDLERLLSWGPQGASGGAGVEKVFTGIAAHKGFEANLSFHGEPLSGTGLLVSSSYFPVLGVRPALGRLIGPGDDRAVGESDVVVLSHASWQRRFGANPDRSGPRRRAGSTG